MSSPIASILNLASFHDTSRGNTFLNQFSFAAHTTTASRLTKLFCWATIVHLFNRVVSRPPCLPPRAFDFPSARTESRKSSFSYAGRSLLNTLVVTSFDRDRILEFKNWFYALFLKLEVGEWRSEANLQRFTPLSSISLLPHPTLPLNECAFTFTNSFQNTTGYRLKLRFIYITPRISNLIYKTNSKNNFSLFHHQISSKPIHSSSSESFFASYHVTNTSCDSNPLND